MKREMQEVKHPRRECRTKTGRWGLAWHLLENLADGKETGPQQQCGGTSRRKKVIRKLSVVPPITRAKAV